MCGFILVLWRLVPLNQKLQSFLLSYSDAFLSEIKFLVRKIADVAFVFFCNLTEFIKTANAF